MNKKLVASVLLTGMAVAYSVYAEDDRTPDEYNPEAKYVSPLDEPVRRIVNDKRSVTEQSREGGFASIQGMLVPGGEETEQPAAAAASETVSQEPMMDATGDGVEKNKEPAKPQSPVIDVAQKEAEEKLVAIDENFEPELVKEYPGFEYQARKYAFDFVQASPATVKSTDTILTTKEKSAGEGTEGETRISDQKDASMIPTVPEKESAATKTVVPEERDTLVTPGVVERKMTAIAQAKETKGSPLIITGEDAQYSSESGDFIIEGKVKLQQGKTRVYSTKAVGNAETGDVWLLEGGTLAELKNTTHAQWAHYNFNKKTGELRYIEGRGEKDSYKAPHGIIENGMLIMDQGGMTTRCPAVKHPHCLEVRAKTITIIPNDRIVARGVKVFVKGVHVYSRDVWVNDLTDTAQRTVPRFGWKDKKGFYISLDYEQPIGNPLAKNPTKAYMHQVYYSKSGYKPFFGLRHDEHDFYVRLHDGYIYDSDDDTLDEGIWLHKKMDWGLFLKPHRIAPGLPLIYEGYVTHGLWKYTNRTWSSRHTEKVIHLRHDRIYPLGDKKLYLDLMLGRKWVSESNPQSSTYGKNLNSTIYDGTIGYGFSPKWNVWARYHNEHKTSYNFTLGQPGFTKEWRTGVSWKPDDKNTLTVINQYNADHGSSYYGNYSTTFSWAHRFCCEVLTISYQRKHYNNKNEWNVKFDLLNW